MSKTFQELDLSNSFLFSAALEDEEICQLVLEIILGFKVPKVKVHAEHNILLNSDFKSVRMDIYASDEMRVSYNLEAQNENKGNLAKRSRYYQGEMDVSALKPGEDYDALNPSYIIFICAFDPFGEKLYRYTFEESCKERDISLGDGTKKIFLNTKGENADEVPQELIHFLKYMEESTNEYVSTITDEPIIRLHEKINELKKWRRLEARYMTLEEWLNDQKEEMRREMQAELEAEIKEVKNQVKAEVKEKIKEEVKAEVKAEVETEAKVRARAEAVLELLSDFGAIPKEIEQKIFAEKEEATLKSWLKLAAKAEDMEQFVKQIGEV